MISFSNINKQYGKQLVFVDASFQLNPGEKVGLVGPNGAGKTTLFRMVVGEEAPDEGDVSVPKRLTIGYFRQDVEEMAGRSVLDEAIAGSGRVGDLHHELEALQHDMGDPDKADKMDKILERFGEVQEEYDHLGGYALEAQAREVLHGLGFEDDQIDGDVGIAHRRLYRGRIAQVGLHGVDLADPAERLQVARQFGAAHGHPDAEVALGQRADHVSPQKARSAKDGDEGFLVRCQVRCHVRSNPAGQIRVVAAIVSGFVVRRHALCLQRNWTALKQFDNRATEPY